MSRPLGCSFFCLLLLGSAIACAGEPARHDAEALLQLLLERAVPEGPEGSVVYVSKRPLAGGTAVPSWHSESVVPETYQQAWFFFVDDAPEANWEHPCRYIFVDVDSGDYEVVEATTPPSELEEMARLFPEEQEPVGQHKE